MKRLPRISAFLAILLIVEFLDELIYSGREAAWPLIRADLHLNYVQIGILLSLPGIIGSLGEMILGILSDTWRRRRLILGGGVSFGLSSLLTGLSPGFAVFFAGSALSSPSSGAFVSLSQATLMDSAPDRHEQNMARWTLAGAVGVVAGPLALSLAVVLGAGWRGLFISLGILTFIVLAITWRLKGLERPAAQPGVPSTPLLQGLRNALRLLKRLEVVRWLVLLQFSDLMLDVLYGFLALYFVDVAGLTPVEAGLAVALWTGASLLGDLLVIPLLEMVSGVAYLRVSVWIELLCFVGLLLAPWLLAKLVLLALLGLFNAGWYPVLQGRLYSAMPGQSGTAVTLTNVGGLAGQLIPLGIGVAAQQFGLGTAIWLLLAGPLALLIGLPGSDGTRTSTDERGGDSSTVKRR